LKMVYSGYCMGSKVSRSTFQKSACKSCGIIHILYQKLEFLQAAAGMIRPLAQVTTNIAAPARRRTMERPIHRFLKYYFMISLVTGPGFLMPGTLSRRASV